MNWIEKMIAEQCPNGVEKVKLGKECEIKTGKGITQKEAQLGGDYPIISGGITPMGMFHIKNRNANTITISRVGANAGYVDFIRKDFYLNDKCFSVIPYKENIFCIKFLFFYLKSIEDKIKDLQSEGGVPTINTTKIGTLEIPLPPLSIQEEIVSVLDKFSELIEKTDEEIALRQKQYEYYREKLLTFDEKVKNVKLGDVCKIYAGGDVPAGCLKGQSEPNCERPYPVFSNGKGPDALYGYASSYRVETAAVTIAARGSIGYHAVRAPFFTPIVRLITVETRNNINIKYIDYILSTVGITGTQGGIPQLTVPMVKKIEIPLPPLSIQEEIVSVLDKFEAMISKLKEERELRQKQYEYYREKLLTF